MAAPASTVWGAIVGGYGRIGINVTTDSTSGSIDVYVDVWFWSKYSVSDATNTLYFDHSSSSGSATTSVGSKSISTTVASGDGWSTSNQVKLYSSSFGMLRGKTEKYHYMYAKLADVDRVGATMYASTKILIPSLIHYNVSYNANGGTGAPGGQTKWYNEALTLSTAKPTRTGYTFQGWATSASGGVAYAAGANYTNNAAVTLYAVWKANTFTVKYDANGGTGAPGNQTKTYGTALTLSSTKPTRKDFTFKGWGTSRSATTVAYAAGASYTANATVTLYAIWEYSYHPPVIYNLSATRCTADGTISDEGTCMLLQFDWESQTTPANCEVYYENNADAADNEEGEFSLEGGTSGTYDSVISIWDDSFSPDSTYTITVTLTNSSGSVSAKTTLPGSVFPIDVLAGGKGVAFGKPAELEGVADFGFEAKFNKPVYGKALGMDRLPAIPANSDFNEYMEPGCYAVQSNAISETCVNIPVARAGRLEVWSSTGEGIRLEQWSYLRQRYIPYNSANAVWEREITRSADNVWRYYDWWQSSLTPAAAEKVYSKAAITLALTENKTLGTVNTYSQIPFDRLAVSTNSRLTMADGSIRIGAGIEYVKVSGQALIKCGNTDGNRHLRIQKVSGSTTTSHAWDVGNAVASSNTIYPFASMIVPVKEGDLIKMVFYTANSTDSVVSGSSTNGWQSYLTVEEL